MYMCGNSPNNKLQPSDCPQFKQVSLSGGKPYVAFTVYVKETSYCTVTSAEEGTLGRPGRKETLVLARALQQCMEKSGVPSRVLCDVAQDLHRFMASLMYPYGDDILEASLPGATNNEPGVSLTLVEEATLLGNNPTPQEAQAITACPSNCSEETPWAWRCNWIRVDESKPPGCVEAVTAAATRIPNASVWTSSTQEQRAPAQDFSRSPARPDFHTDGHSQKQIHMQIQVPVWNTSSRISTHGPAWYPGPAW